MYNQTVKTLKVLKPFRVWNVDYKKFRLVIVLIIAMIVTGACTGLGASPVAKIHPTVGLTPQAKLSQAETQAVETPQAKMTGLDVTTTQTTTLKSLINEWGVVKENVAQVRHTLSDYRHRQAVKQARNKAEMKRTGYELEVATIQMEQALNEVGLTAKGKNTSFFSELHALAGRLEGRNYETNRMSRTIEHVKQEFEKTGEEIRSLLHPS